MRVNAAPCMLLQEHTDSPVEVQEEVESPRNSRHSLNLFSHLFGGDASKTRTIGDEVDLGFRLVDNPEVGKPFSNSVCELCARFRGHSDSENCQCDFDRSAVLRSTSDLPSSARQRRWLLKYGFSERTESMRLCAHARRYSGLR